MFQQTLAIIRNTFFESVRQPIMLVVLVAATIALILSNPLAAFTMDDDQRMLIDIGLATVFLCGALLAAFIATNVLGREIDNRTALTVISKPVSRPVFVIGKYLGVAGALALGTLYMSFVFLLVEQHTVLQTVRDPIHLPVVFFSFLAGVIGLGVGVWCNYFYNRVFSSTVICVTTPLAGLAYLFSMMFRPDFSMQPIAAGFKPQLWIALIALMIAILVLAAIAVAASTRLGQVMTLCVTVGVFMLGMLSDWLCGRQIEQMHTAWRQEASAQNLTEMIAAPQTPHIITNQGIEITTIPREIEVSTVPLLDFATSSEKFEYAMYRVGYSVLPNFQVLWLSDALTQSHAIPLDYLANAALYGFLHITAALGIAVMLFQTREVG